MTDLEVINAMREATTLSASKPMVAEMFGLPPYKKPDDADWENFNARINDDQVVVNAALSIIDKRLGGAGGKWQLLQAIAQIVESAEPMFGYESIAGDILSLLKGE